MSKEQIEEAAEELAEEIEETIEEENKKEAETNEHDVEEAAEEGDAVVAAAAIESDTKIRLAEIQAELERERMKLEEKGNKAWTETVERLEGEISALKTKVEAMQNPNPSTLEDLTEQAAEIAEEVSEAEAENNSTQKFMSPRTSETKTEVSLENEDGKKGQSGGQNKTKPQDNLTASVEQLSNALILCHTGLSLATKTPEIAIDKEEGDLLANGVVKVLEQYDIKPDPKTEAIIGLIIACSTVYAPRIVTINARIKSERKAKKEEKGTVYNADGTFAGETTFSEVNNFSEGADNTGTI